ncbi:MAG: response regulator [Gemmatimonadaceae bacterium]
MQTYNLERLNILIVDDNKHMQILLKEVFRALGVMSVRTSDAGADAFKEMKVFAADIVICDWNILYGLWGRPVNFNDANGDGLIVPSEITYADLRFIGPSFPTHELTVTPTLGLLQNKLRVTAQVDHKGGMRKLNNTLRHQCQGGQSCRGLYDKDAPLADQAAAIAANANVFTSFYDDGAFTRFRELGVTYQLPDAWAQRLRASRLSVTGTGRNLAVWTKYGGVDPEATVGNSDTRGNEEFFSTPPLRVFTLRANLSF